MLGEKGTAVGLVGEVTFCCWLCESVVFVVIVRGCEVGVAEAVGEVCVVGDNEVGEPTVGADLAWKLGFVVVRARNAEKKFEKKGLCVGAMVMVRAWCDQRRRRAVRSNAQRRSCEGLGLESEIRLQRNRVLAEEEERGVML